MATRIELFNDILNDLGDGEVGLNPTELAVGMLVSLSEAIGLLTPDGQRTAIFQLAQGLTGDTLSLVRESRGIIETTGTEV